MDTAILIIFGLSNIVGGISIIANREKNIKIVKDYSFGLLSDSACKKALYIIGPFFCLIGIIFFVNGIKRL